MIDINGLDKTEVLCALYNGAKHDGPQILLTAAAASSLIAKNGLNFACIKGREIHANLYESAFNGEKYDAANGKGSAQAAIDRIRPEYFCVECDMEDL